MKQVLHDVEMRMDCYCGDPHDFIHLGFDVAKYDWPPELYLTFRVYHGGFIKRLKKAWHLLWAGWVERYPDVTSVGIDEIEKLRDFCDKCIAAEADKGEKP